ncbi:DUF3995 domain-containing protein [Flavobacterium aquidurense]|jgi:glucan phosphoethanolaminetransferase (alkaline phosphatase superfamily)|uniref:DUF3995 domain-containing protein n=1 Tax=Flavobacterium aquidurense TaxID=362413 RepID=UPI00091631DE|nr:DUF3995 domain-containing protein [Flavobacterium aquidurense]OXA70448.1 hypothetical protein B0A67_15640 [Flavobacterium aquidurense]SHH73384.1 Protein of unknown function [Flavobacterium frigidimaris]
MIIITLVLFLIFATISALHFYWGFGGKWGSQAVVPTKDDGMPLFVPRTISTFIVAIGLLGFGIFYLIKYGLIAVSLPEWLNKSGFWIIISIFILRAIGDFNYVGFFKKHKSSEFAIKDTKYYAPLCLLIGVLTLILVFCN